MEVTFYGDIEAYFFYFGNDRVEPTPLVGIVVVGDGKGRGRNEIL